MGHRLRRPLVAGAGVECPKCPGTMRPSLGRPAHERVRLTTPACREALLLQFVAAGLNPGPASSAPAVRADSARVLGNDVDFSLWLLRMGASEAGCRHGHQQRHQVCWTYWEHGPPLKVTMPALGVRASFGRSEWNQVMASQAKPGRQVGNRASCVRFPVILAKVRLIFAIQQLPLSKASRLNGLPALRVHRGL
jgi:hypothetical protein